MKRRTALFAAAILASYPAFAQDTQDSVDHYAGESAETLAQAQANLAEYNAKMAATLAKPDLSANDMEDIHQMTYTLEVALAKIISEATALAETLERVHHASEMGSAGRLRDLATQYLTVAQQLVR